MLLRDAIAALLADPADVLLARSILGSVDAGAIATRVEAHVRGELGAAVVACPLFTQSVGAVFVLDLDDGRRVVLKAHTADTAGLSAAYRIQHQLAGAAYPCAPVVSAPRPWPDRAAAIMGYLDAPPADDPHAPSTRRALAEGLALITELAGNGDIVGSTSDLPRASLPADSLFPPAHNVLFDLSAPGGEWIDARARAARDTLDTSAAHPIATHGDFSAANVRVSAGAVAAVFDLDSLELVDEATALARTAVHYTYRGDAPWTWPTRAQAIAFVDDYLRARAPSRRPDLDRRRLDAAAIYALAYTARCEFSITAATAPDTPMCALLRAAPDAYFG